LHGVAAEAGQAAAGEAGDTVAGLTAYYKKISEFLGPGERTQFKVDPATGIGGPDIPAGHTVFVNDLDHVMLSTGTRDAQGRQEVFSHWVYPQQTPAGEITTQTFGVMQKTSIEEVLSSSGMHDAVVESAAPSWLL
jgi:hypothetical protein